MIDQNKKTQSRHNTEICEVSSTYVKMKWENLKSRDAQLLT